MKSFKRKLPFLILSGSLAILLLYILYLLRFTGNSEAASGIYVASGGESLILLESRSLGRLKASGTRISSLKPFIAPERFSLTSSFSKDRLILKQKETYGKGFKSIYQRYLLILILQPSQAIPGDWDLINAELKEGFIPFKSPVLHLIPGSAPYYSFLHRVNDDRVKDYYLQKNRESVSKDTLQLIRRIANDHPDDPYIHLQLIENEAIQGDLERARDLFETWEKKYMKHPDAFLGHSGHEVFKILSRERLEKEYPDLPDFLAIFGSPQASLSRVLSWFQDFWNTGLMIFPPLSGIYLRHSITTIHAIEIEPRVCKIIALFYLFQGRREESLTLLASLYRLGQSLNSDGLVIQRLVGMSVRKVASEGLQCFVLNACETKEEFRKCREILTKIHETPGMDAAENTLVGEFTFLRSRMIEDSPQNYIESQTRHQVNDMKFQLIRLAAAVKHHLVVKGDFPASEKDLSSFLGGEIPGDVFGDKVPLHYNLHSKEECAVYSYGPDKDDDKTSLEYDPTNGVTSDGDIVITIPLKREFPFPKQGVHAATAYDLLLQFPNGLPPDVFAHTKYLPFSIIESTETHPVVIFSFGPNGDEEKSSSIIQPGYSFLPVPTPPPASNAGYGRSIQKIFRRAEQYPPPPGCWTLEPFYDPTNGTGSRGDLFIEIPRY